VRELPCGILSDWSKERIDFLCPVPRFFQPRSGGRLKVAPSPKLRSEHNKINQPPSASLDLRHAVGGPFNMHHFRHLNSLTGIGCWLQGKKGDAQAFSVSLEGRVSETVVPHPFFKSTRFGFRPAFISADSVARQWVRSILHNAIIEHSASGPRASTAACAHWPHID